MFKQVAGLDWVTVHYKGGAPAVQDLLGGSAQVMFANISDVIGQVKAGKLTPIAVTTPRRSAIVPDVPTLAESGFPKFSFSTPATYGECERLIQTAAQGQSWQEVGVLAQTKPTKNRPAASYQVWESSVTLYGTPYRAVVVHSSSQDRRRQKRLEREFKTDKATLEARVGKATKQSYFCHEDAAQAADKLRAQPSAYHRLEVELEERPQYGPGRPSAHKPREVKAMHYGLQVSLHERPEVMAQKAQEAGCFVLLSNVPSKGEMAHSAQEVLVAYKEQHGIEQNYGFLKDPQIVNSLFLEKPERIEALGLVLLLSLLIWRLIERTLRQYVETTGSKLSGWDHNLTDRPTAFMMMTKFSSVIVLKIGHKRQLAREFSTPQQQYLLALGLSAACYTFSSG
jgi:hypothetical protein